MTTRELTQFFNNIKPSSYTNFLKAWVYDNSTSVPIIINRDAIHALVPDVNERGTPTGYCKLLVAFDPYIIYIEQREAERIAQWLMQ
jgi:hypothetical protein